MQRALPAACHLYFTPDDYPSNEIRRTVPFHGERKGGGVGGCKVAATEV